LCLASTPHCPASLFVVPPDPDHPALHSFPTRRSSISLREEHKNRITQLFVRTGQPGMAPERTVLDRYDINGYFTKVEATEDKLYSLVKSGVRQYLWSVAALAGTLMLKNAIEAGDNRAAIVDVIRKTFEGIHFVGDAPAETRSVQVAVLFGDQVLGTEGLTSDQAATLKKGLSGFKGVQLSPDGDS